MAPTNDEKRKMAKQQQMALQMASYYDLARRAGGVSYRDKAAGATVPTGWVFSETLQYYVPPYLGFPE